MMAREPGIVVEGRWYPAAAAYRLELGEEALERSQALPDPAKLLRRRAKVDQPPLFDPSECQGKKPSSEELYEREHG